MSRDSSGLPALFRWTLLGRALVFALAASSIWCLLAEFYRLCSMRTFTLYVLIPASAALVIIALLDFLKGDRRLFAAVVIGAIGGFIAACCYDIYRLPFVVAAADHVGPMWLRLPLFKVFPRFGAMILGQSFTPTQTDSQFTLLAHLVGWIYHLSNGVTFGIMYMALIGSAIRRSWWWGAAFAVFLEIMLLITPYASFFGIGMTTRFILATLTAHFIFGIALGLYARHKSLSWRVDRPAIA